MDSAQVEGWVRDRKRLEVIALFKQIAQLHNPADGVVHQLNRVDPARRIAGVAGLALNTDRVGHMAFVGADRLQGGGLADDGAVRAQLGGFGKIARAGHAGLFVGGGQNIQRFFQRGDVDIAQGVENKGEEAFHVSRAEAVELVIVFGEGERIPRPAAIIEWHGIGMPGEQQAAGAVSGAGQQVEFMARIRHRLYLNIEAEIAEPACQQID